MALLAGDLIDEARDLHPAFDKNRNPQKIVRRELSRYVTRLLSKIDQIDEAALTIEAETVMPLAVFANGIVLPANRNVQEVVAVDAQGRKYPVEIIPAGQRDSIRQAATAWIINGVLYLNGTAATWNQVAKVAVRYTPVAGQVATDATVVPLPDSARPPIIAALAAFMAKRGHTDKDGDLPPVIVDGFRADLRESEGEFLEEVGNSRTSQVFRVRDVWPR